MGSRMVHGALLCGGSRTQLSAKPSFEVTADPNPSPFRVMDAGMARAGSAGRRCSTGKGWVALGNRVFQGRLRAGRAGVCAQHSERASFRGGEAEHGNDERRRHRKGRGAPAPGSRFARPGMTNGRRPSVRAYGCIGAAPRPACGPTARGTAALAPSCSATMRLAFSIVMSQAPGMPCRAPTARSYSGRSVQPRPL